MTKVLWVNMVMVATLSGAEKEAPATPPTVDAKLLFCSRLGGSGDQWFSQVSINRDQVVTGNREGLRLSVRIGPDDAVTATASGDREAQSSDLQTSLPNGGTVGPYAFGFKQVDALLQQPFLKGPGWSLWGWSNEQAQKAIGPTAPYQADSRVRGLFPIGKGMLCVVGWSDGGNSSFQAWPNDINRQFPHSLNNSQTGGFHGWMWKVSSQGKVLAGTMFRWPAHFAMADDWGRVLMTGERLIAGDTSFGAIDGAGIVLLDAEWKTMEFRGIIGSRTEQNKGVTQTWHADLDSKRGLMAVCGWTDAQDINGVAAVQDHAGGGKDAILAVFRLWPDQTKRGIR